MESQPDDRKRAANAAYMQGNVFWRAGRLVEAEASYLHALELAEHPDIRLNLANVQLCLGKDREGWANLQHRPERRRAQTHRLSYPEWRGEPLAGKRLFIWQEQGLGDQIFIARYIARLGSTAEITIAARPELASLFEQLPARVIRASDRMDARDHDYWALPFGLPQWIEPAPCPYLAASPRGQGGVGVMWRGNSAPDPGRSLPRHLAERLLALPGAISLQPEDTGAADMADTAAIIAGLDEVITIDTSIAHLTGALGKRGTVLLQHHFTDWRWRPGEPGRSAWYPTLRLVRQPSPGDWESVVDAVVAGQCGGRDAPPRATGRCQARLDDTD